MSLLSRAHRSTNPRVLRRTLGNFHLCLPFFIDLSLTLLLLFLFLQVCGKCVQLKRCQACRNKVSSDRNLAWERFSQQFRYSCRNTSAGCPVFCCPEPGAQGRANHEAQCAYRRHNCLFRTCPWTGLAGQEQFNHLKEVNHFLIPHL